MLDVFDGRLDGLFDWVGWELGVVPDGSRRHNRLNENVFTLREQWTAEEC